MFCFLAILLVQVHLVWHVLGNRPLLHKESCGKEVSLTPVFIYEIAPLHFSLGAKFRGSLVIYCIFYGQGCRSKMIPPEYWRQQIGLLPVLTSTYGTVGAAASAKFLWNKSLKMKMKHTKKSKFSTHYFLKKFQMMGLTYFCLPFFQKTSQCLF